VLRERSEISLTHMEERYTMGNYEQQAKATEREAERSRPCRFVHFRAYRYNSGVQDQRSQARPFPREVSHGANLHAVISSRLHGESR
jgi:hypothetical protein